VNLRKDHYRAIKRLSLSSLREPSLGRRRPRDRLLDRPDRSNSTRPTRRADRAQVGAALGARVRVRRRDRAVRAVTAGRRLPSRTRPPFKRREQGTAAELLAELLKKS
jgi:hypothetical protein